MRQTVDTSSKSGDRTTSGARSRRVVTPAGTGDGPSEVTLAEVFRSVLVEPTEPLGEGDDDPDEPGHRLQSRRPVYAVDPSAPPSTVAWLKANPEGAPAAATVPARGTVPVRGGPDAAAVPVVAVNGRGFQPTTPSPTAVGPVIGRRERMTRNGVFAAIGLTAVITGVLTLTPDEERLETAADTPAAAVDAIPSSPAGTAPPAVAEADLLRDAPNSSAPLGVDGQAGAAGAADPGGATTTTTSGSTARSGAARSADTGTAQPSSDSTPSTVAAADRTATVAPSSTAAEAATVAPSSSAMPSSAAPTAAPSTTAPSTTAPTTTAPTTTAPTTTAPSTTASSTTAPSTVPSTTAPSTSPSSTAPSSTPSTTAPATTAPSSTSAAGAKPTNTAASTLVTPSSTPERSSTTPSTSTSTSTSTSSATASSSSNTASGTATTAEPDGAGSTTAGSTGPAAGPRCPSAWIADYDDDFGGTTLHSTRWTVVGVGAAPGPQIEVAGGMASISTGGDDAGGLLARTSQVHGRFEARVQGAGRLALVAPGSTVSVASVATSGPGGQTLSIEWTPTEIVVRRDGRLIQTVSDNGAGLVPTTSLSVAVFADGAGSGQATLAVDDVVVDRLAPCGTSGPN